ncbi:MAG: hypothetical protein EB091_05425 [Betaproteobacteria bacterium]|nr:hypothetical protein [Betaproteobacteria bacterium]NCX71820.1 hypothetical protein [Betaproteobacteria bacterium]NCZ48038.1 hypothetical protein [Betaproteobacteria bacterium]NDA88325.1 hypothetical protein [Betaproteobacteria bacterium]NDB40891.1 hypothetical protein [Betaproteobacteria bacterium]
MSVLSSLAEHPWAYPAFQVVHLVGMSLLLGNLVLLELRVFGLGSTLPIHDLARLSLAVVIAGFTLLLISGLLMFATQALELLANRVFLWKIMLIMLAAMNAAAFHARGSLDRRDRIARLQMIASMLIWLAVLACGRAIAYV